jgi:hypothetical protein
MIYRIIILCVALLFLNNCSATFTNLFTIGGVSTAVASKNAYSIGYSGVDLMIQIQTDKPIRDHVLDRINKKKETTNGD